MLWHRPRAQCPPDLLLPERILIRGAAGNEEASAETAKPGATFWQPVGGVRGHMSFIHVRLCLMLITRGVFGHHGWTQMKPFISIESLKLPSLAVFLERLLLTEWTDQTPPPFPSIAESKLLAWYKPVLVLGNHLSWTFNFVATDQISSFQGFGGHPVNHLPSGRWLCRDEHFVFVNIWIEWRLTSTWGRGSLPSFSWICSPHLIALPPFSGAFSSFYHHGSICIQISAFVGGIESAGRGQENSSSKESKD